MTRNGHDRLPDPLADHAGHVVGSLNDLGIHLVSPLGGDQFGDLLDRVDVGILEIALGQRSEGDISRKAGDSSAGRLADLEQVAAEGREPGWVGEVGECDLADRDRRRGAADRREDLAGLVDFDVGGARRNGDGGLET